MDLSDGDPGSTSIFCDLSMFSVSGFLRDSGDWNFNFIYLDFITTRGRLINLKRNFSYLNRTGENPFFC